MRLAVSVVVLVFSGCNPHDFGGIESEAPGEDSEDVVAEGLAPELRSLTASATAVTEDESVEFVARVTDVDGQDDLQGGALLSEQGGLYGTFVKDDDTNTWRVSVSWDDIQAVEPIDFDDELARPFFVEFRDKENQTVREQIEVTLHCNGMPACDGRCGQAGTTDGACAETGWQDCIEVAPGETFECQDVCRDNGLTCALSLDEFHSVWGLSYSPETCAIQYFVEVETSLTMCDAESVGHPDLYSYVSCNCG